MIEKMAMNPGLGARRALMAAGAVLPLVLQEAAGGPWIEAGDAQLRSDIEILAGASVIDNVTMQWPLPWGGVLDRLDNAALGGQPDYVREAAERVQARGQVDTKTGELRTELSADFAGSPAFLRGFDALGRQTMQGQVIADYSWGSTAVHLAMGAQSVNRIDRQVFVPDGSYVAQRIGGAWVYAGYVNHWWGPGWISAMSLSTNARPVPQVGITRASTEPFKTPWLSWLGPWQLEFFVGVLNGPRIARDTIYDGLRFNFSPLPHLEIGLSRTDQMCGSGHPCKPLVGYFGFKNDNSSANIVNDQSSIDIRYSGAFSGFSYALYAQAMAEDTNPVDHSVTSHLFGGSLWLPVNDMTARLTVEYADSRPTRNIWGGEIFHGSAYNNYDYVDGMRYRGRTLGFSLDSDSRLFSIQAGFIDQLGRSLTVTYHHAEVSDPRNTWTNVVTSAPVTINMGQARLGFPLTLGRHSLRVEFEARVQDDQPRPNSGTLVTAELSLAYRL